MHSSTTELASGAAPAEASLSSPRRVWRRSEGLSDSNDWLVTEEPLELRLCGAPIAVVMRTPGHDRELGLGFAITERLVASAGDLERLTHCSTGEHPENVLLLTPRPGCEPDIQKLQRRLYATSSCGICGKQSISQALAEAPPINAQWQVAAGELAELPSRLRQRQPVFAATGGLHAAGLFDERGQLLVVREDVGRHNAVDKCIGWALSGNLSVSELSRCGLMLSGRLSYEVVQKALAARIPLVAGVGAVSSLAVELARRGNMTLVGFTTSERFCIYAGEERIA